MCKSKVKQRKHLVQFEIRNLKKMVGSTQNIKLYILEVKTRETHFDV